MSPAEGYECSINDQVLAIMVKKATCGLHDVRRT